MTRQSILAASQERELTLYGASGSYIAYLCAGLAEISPVVVVVENEQHARKLTTDIQFFADDDLSPLHVPEHGGAPYAERSPDREALGARLASLSQLLASSESRRQIVVLSAASLTRRVMEPATFAQLNTTLKTGQELSLAPFIEFLVRAGYLRTRVVWDPGSFALRGGTLDLYPSLSRFPVRIELSGEEIETLRTFDPESQRTLRILDELAIHPMQETLATAGVEPRVKILEAADLAHHPSQETRRILEAVDSGENFVGLETLTPAFHRQLVPLWRYLARDALWIRVEPEAIAALCADRDELAQKQFCQRLAERRLAFSPAAHYVDSAALGNFFAGCPRVNLNSLEPARKPFPYQLAHTSDISELVLQLARTRRDRAGEIGRILAERLARWQQEKNAVAVAIASPSRAEKLRSTLKNYQIAAPDYDSLRAIPKGTVGLVRGQLSQGFLSPSDHLAVLSEAEIFGPARRGVSTRQKRAAKRAQQALAGGVADFSNLAAGDCLVHELHGVGRYQGLCKLVLGETPVDFLNIEYRGGTLYLPVYRMDEVARYVGVEGCAPKLDHLGGASFASSRAKVKKKVHALAEELLQLYAQRATTAGFAFPPADTLYEDFVAGFEFVETPDQSETIARVLTDMESQKPMDRLVCGDVGYGKTEVALRAMLKASLGGKQTAFLAPTTVLVEQHYQTMRKRFARWPLTIGRLSRFLSKKEQTSTVLGLAQGRVDVVVGTHRLLAKDLRFKDLGLVIIDEEQRFGVAHKEQLKQMRAQVDVLTMTATPIPRTLHLALSGLRDLSILATPPADRRAIRTFVARPEDSVIREGIERELARKGQVFFISPRIHPSRGDRRSLQEWAQHIDEICAPARVAVAHGQMTNQQLEETMVRFVQGEYDVLVSTTIVESGLDIPRANTMFIADANQLGLSQLYQLRGRIGRSEERAYCYLLVPPLAHLTAEARQRLETLQRFSDLGAGFSIASRDLELRGGGELLGAKQSGSIAAVGFDAYINLLEQAVAELKGEEIHSPLAPQLNAEQPGYIPDDYVPDTGQRIDLYKRLAGGADADEIAEILDEIADLYGARPEPVNQLGELMVLKTYAQKLGVIRLELTPSKMVLTFADSSALTASELVKRASWPGQAYRLTADKRLCCPLATTGHKTTPNDAARTILLALVACATTTPSH